jgi:hypothetical protein
MVPLKREKKKVEITVYVHKELILMEIAAKIEQVKSAYLF